VHFVLNCSISDLFPTKFRLFNYFIIFGSNKLTKKIVRKSPGVQRGRGRPKSRWIDGVEKDAQKLACRNWLPTAQDRDTWRYLLEKTKVHSGLYSRWWSWWWWWWLWRWSLIH